MRPTFSLEGGLDGLPLRVSHRKANAKAEVEGRKDAESNGAMLSLNLNLNLLVDDMIDAVPQTECLIHTFERGPWR